MNLFKRFRNWFRREPKVAVMDGYDETKPFFHPLNQRAFDEGVRETVRNLKQADIRDKNLKHRTKFSNSEHFKRRQPTTARMLWKPDAELEED